MISWRNDEPCGGFKLGRSSRVTNVKVNQPEATDTSIPKTPTWLSETSEQTNKSPEVYLDTPADEGHAARRCDLGQHADNDILDQSVVRLLSYVGQYCDSVPLSDVGVKMAKETWLGTSRLGAVEVLLKDLCNTSAGFGMLDKEYADWSAQNLESPTLAPWTPRVSLIAESEKVKRIEQLAADEAFIFYWPKETREGLNACVRKRNIGFSEFSGRP